MLRIKHCGWAGNEGRNVFHDEAINDLKKAMTGKRALLIAGPTASGKSALAIKLAQQLDGLIINTDSMQVYQDLHILTARPSIEEMAEAPHRLYGHRDGALGYDVAQWLEEAEKILNECEQNNKTAIFVGGTGLYFKSLTQGLAQTPPIPDELTQSLRLEAEREKQSQKQSENLHQRLSVLDPISAERLKPNDHQRILRALAVVQSTGKPLWQWQKTNSKPLLGEGEFHFYLITMPREEVYQRINQRFENMMQQGALDEVRALQERHLSPALPVMRAHGVPWLIRHLKGEISLAEAITQSQTDTRHYAKRQLTWWRNQRL